MLILRNKVPRLGLVYVSAAKINLYELKQVESYSDPGKFIRLLQPYHTVELGSKLALLEINLEESKLLGNDEAKPRNDWLLYKFFDLKANCAVYLRMTSIFDLNTSKKDVERANHLFSFYFVTLEEWMEGQRG